MTLKKQILPTEQNVKDYNFLKDMLKSQKIEFDLLSKKKADTQLNPLKTKMMNRVLVPLKELFKNEESFAFLDILSEDDMPSNSDVVLIISQYETAIKKFSLKYYVFDEYQVDKYGHNIKRWMTIEFPPDYYSDKR